MATSEWVDYGALMNGTLINAAAIVFGSLVGLLIAQRGKISQKPSFMHIMGIFTLIMGFKSVATANNGPKFVCTLGAVLIGGLIGEVLGLEARLETWVKKIELKYSRGSDGRFITGFVTSSLLYCVGPVAILGSLQDGLKGDLTLLITKSALDGVTSIAMTATLGIGVLFSAIPILIYQGAITLLAKSAQVWLTPPVIDGVSASGGILLMAIGFNILGTTRISVTNLTPALILSGIGGAWFFV